MSRAERIEYTILHGDCVATTEKAILLALKDGAVQQCWIPRTCLAIGQDEQEEEEDISIDVATWFCKKEGLV